MAQSVWVATQTKQGIKLVDMTGKPQAAASFGGALEGSTMTSSGTGAIIEATRVAGEQGRRIVSATLVGNEIVLVVD